MRRPRQPFGGKLPLWGILALLLLSPFNIKHELADIQIDINSILLWCLLGYALVQVWESGGLIKLRRVPFLWLWALYALSIAIGFAAGPGNLRNPVQAVWAIFRNVELLLLYPIIIQIIHSEERVKRAVGAIVLGIVLAALVGIGQTLTDGRYLSGLSEQGNHRYIGLLYSTPFDPRNIGWQLGAPFFRAHGPAASPNLLASLLNLGLCVTFGFLIASKRVQTHTWKWTTVLIILLTTLFMTLSRSGWVSFVVAVTAILAIQLRPSFKSIARVSLALGVITGILAVVMLVLPETIRERAATIRQPLQTIEVQSRIEVWQIAWQSIQQHPWLGVGTDRISGESLTTWGINPPDLSPHNIFLVAAYQYGLPHFFLFLTFLIISFFTGLRLAWKGPTVLARAVGLGTVGFLVALSVHGLFDSLLLPRTMIILFWSMFALVTTLRLIYLGQTRSTAVPQGSPPVPEAGSAA